MEHRVVEDEWEREERDGGGVAEGKDKQHDDESKRGRLKGEVDEDKLASWQESRLRLFFQLIIYIREIYD